MFKVLKITSRLVLVLGLIVLSLRPSASNYVPPGTFHQQTMAFSKSTSLASRTPGSHRSSEMRSSFHKNDDKRRLPMAVVGLPLAKAFVFNTPRFNLGTSSVSFLTASSPSQSVVLRI
jgi:hypothetical protein